VLKAPPPHREPAGRPIRNTSMSRRSIISLASAACAALALAGCASRKPPPPVVEAAPPPPPARIACAPTRADDPMIGTWYSASHQKGYAGDFQTLTVLSPDGTMTYETQLKVGRKTRPALRESGCWNVADGVYTMQTITSNGEDVDTSDPIYTNRYRVEKIEKGKLVLREIKGGGQAMTAQRMQAGYRLPN
jgi:hypothetical protein